MCELFVLVSRILLVEVPSFCEVVTDVVTDDLFRFKEEVLPFGLLIFGAELDGDNIYVQGAFNETVCASECEDLRVLPSSVSECDVTV